MRTVVWRSGLREMGYGTGCTSDVQLVATMGVMAMTFTSLVVSSAYLLFALTPARLGAGVAEHWRGSVPVVFPHGALQRLIHSTADPQGQTPSSD